MARLECRECGEVVAIVGDDAGFDERPEDYRCLLCRDPRQREFDEFREMEASL